MEEMTQESVLRMNALRYGGYIIPYWDGIDRARVYILADCDLSFAWIDDDNYDINSSL